MSLRWPMLAVASDPPAHYGWAEWKFDGHSTLVTNRPCGVRVTSRGGPVVTARYSEVAAALVEVLADRGVELDGELVAPGHRRAP